MASGPITSWQIGGKTVETVTDFIFGYSKITSDGDCSHEIKRCMLLGRKVMTNLYSILKTWDITLPTKVHLVKAMVFLVVMYGCESWSIKKAECRRIDDFELWCWRRLLRAPWTARRSNQAILREISPEYSLEAETPVLWPPDSKNWLIWKDPEAGKDWKWEERGMTENEMVGWHRWLNGYDFGWTPGVGDGHRGLACCSQWGCKESDMTEWLNWTEPARYQNMYQLFHICYWDRRQYFCFTDGSLYPGLHSQLHERGRFEAIHGMMPINYKSCTVIQGHYLKFINWTLLMTEDEMVGSYHRLNGHEFEQTPGDSEGQGCCSPWGHEE